MTIRPSKACLALALTLSAATWAAGASAQTKDASGAYSQDRTGQNQTGMPPQPTIPPPDTPAPTSNPASSSTGQARSSGWDNLRGSTTQGRARNGANGNWNGQDGTGTRGQTRPDTTHPRDPYGHGANAQGSGGGSQASGSSDPDEPGGG